MRWRRQDGQIATENTVVAGIVVTATVALLAMATPCVQTKIALVATCVVSDTCIELDAPCSLWLGGGGGGGGTDSSDGSGGSGGGGGVGGGGEEVQACMPGQVACERYEGETCDPGSWACWSLAQWFDDAARAVVEVGPRALCGTIGWEIAGIPGAAFGAANCSFNTQNWKAEAKRERCCLCQQAEECDGTVAQVGNVRCVLNDSDGMPSDLAESVAMIDDVTRMMNGEPYKIAKNDAVISMKEEILSALQGHAGPDDRIELIAHSQGAAVLSNAVWQLRQDGLLSDEDLARLDIVIMGPAEYRFPIGANVTMYDNVAARQFSVGDPINDAADLYRQMRLTGDGDGLVASVSSRPVSWSCGLNVVGCHDMQNYLQAHALSEKNGEKPVTSIVVNGINTERDDQLSAEQVAAGDGGWKYQGSCKCYDAARYEGGACSSNPSQISEISGGVSTPLH